MPRKAEQIDGTSVMRAVLLRGARVSLHAEFTSMRLFEAASVKAFLRKKLPTLRSAEQLHKTLRRHYVRRCSFCSSSRPPALLCDECGGPRFTERDLPSIEQLRRFITKERMGTAREPSSKPGAGGVSADMHRI